MTETVPNVGLWSTWPSEPGNDHLVVLGDHKKAPTEVRAGGAFKGICAAYAATGLVICSRMSSSGMLDRVFRSSLSSSNRARKVSR